MPKGDSKTSQTAKQETKQAQVVRIHIGDQVSKKKATRRKKRTTRRKKQPMPEMTYAPPVFQQTSYQFTPTIPSYQSSITTIPPPPPPVSIPAPTPTPEPERERVPPTMTGEGREGRRPSRIRDVAQGIGRGLWGILEGMGERPVQQFAELGQGAPIVAMPPPEPIRPSPVLSAETREIVSIPPEVAKEEPVKVPKKKLVEVRTGLGTVQLQEQEMISPPAEEPPRIPTEEERIKMREARLRAIPYEEPKKKPEPSPLQRTMTSAPSSLDINSFTYEQLMGAYRDWVNFTGVKLERVGKKGKTSKKELFDFFKDNNYLDIVYQEY